MIKIYNNNLYKKKTFKSNNKIKINNKKYIIK